MGYFSALDAAAQEWADTELADDFEVEFMVHLYHAKVENFEPLTREQFYAAAHAALAKIDDLFPTPSKV